MRQDRGDIDVIGRGGIGVEGIIPGRGGDVTYAPRDE